MDDVLGDALESTETATPDPAQVEETEQPDSSLNPTEPVAEQVKPKVESKAELDFAELRGHRDTLEKELSEFRGKVDRLGGESHLQIMAPVLEKAMEIPSTAQERERWSGETWQAMNQSFLPEQVSALKSEAAWSFLQDPASQRVIVSDLYGQDVTPELLQTLIQAYRTDPSIVYDPNETLEQRAYREQQEAREAQTQAQLRALTEQNEKREAESQAIQTQQVMGDVLKVSLAPITEIKKQFGLEFQKTDGDTPEIASWKERQSARYDRIVRAAIAADSEANRISNQAEYLAKQKDQSQRQRATNDMAPIMEQRIRKICSEVAKDLAADLSLFAPGISDRAKGETLKGLQPQVLGGGGANANASGYDLSDMPDPINNPRGFEVWVQKRIGADAAARNTPGILNAG